MTIRIYVSAAAITLDVDAVVAAIEASAWSEQRVRFLRHGLVPQELAGVTSRDEPRQLFEKDWA